MTHYQVHSFQSSSNFEWLGQKFELLTEDQVRNISYDLKYRYQFNVVNRQSQMKSWTIDLKSEKPTVVSGVLEYNPDVVITIHDDLLHKIFSGKKKAQKAFLHGKIKAKGKKILAVRLDYLFKIVYRQAKL